MPKDSLGRKLQEGDYVVLRTQEIIVARVAKINEPSVLAAGTPGSMKMPGVVVCIAELPAMFDVNNGVVQGLFKLEQPPLDAPTKPN